MRAAVVRTVGASPTEAEFEEPKARDGECVVSVRAAPISPIARALAARRHYASAGASPRGFVPGVDGVGVDHSGRRVYFLFPKAPFGAMAERSLVALDSMVPVPDALTDTEAAALASAGLGSWIALSRRAPIREGATVLINGATGAAGSMAVKVARYFGATKVVAVGRDARKLPTLGADVQIVLDSEPHADTALRAQFDEGVHVVLDFVWGEPATRVLRAATRERGSWAGEPRLRYIQIGTAAGDEIPMRGDIFRSTGLELLGSGIGSVAVADLVAGAGELLVAAVGAGFRAAFTTVPLSDIERAWNDAPGARCLVIPLQTP